MEIHLKAIQSLPKMDVFAVEHAIKMKHQSFKNEMERIDAPPRLPSDMGKLHA